MPKPNYFAYASFGSLELRKREQTEFIGQTIDYSECNMIDVQTTSLDALNFPRLDLIKVDVEGMEFDALAGAVTCVSKHRPILLIEMAKSDKSQLRAWLESAGYSVLEAGMNLLALHKGDSCLAHVQMASAA